MRNRRKTINADAQLIGNLSLAAVLRVKKAVENYRVMAEQHKTALKEFETAKPSLIRAHQDKEKALENKIKFLKVSLEPIDHLAKELKDKLRNHELSFLGSLITPSANIIFWNRTKYDKLSKPIIQKIESLNAEYLPLRILESELRDIQYSPAIQPPTAPSNYFRIRESSKTYTFDALAFTDELIEKAIDEKKQEKLIKNENSERLKAKANAYDEKQRDLAKSIRNNIKHQLKRHPYCPYCFAPLNESDAHADHIYPLAHGGLSTSYNMVFVCSICNMNKGEKTLREFINKRRLDEKKIHIALETLGKRF